ncbi:MAG: hypothetical protein FVQ84_06715, partial [Planctomycetes bacterium]|nr:hypothetical protein [Planctomycetota bacterium]
MPYEVIVDNINREEWERYAREFADYNIYQTQAYQGNRAEMDNQEVSRIVIRDENGKVVTMCHVRIKHIKLLTLKIGYVQWGPLVRGRDGTLKCSSPALKALRKAYVGTKVDVLRVVPNACNDEEGRTLVRILRAAGFAHASSIKPYRTLMLPVNVSEEELRKRLSKSF